MSKYKVWDRKGPMVTPNGKVYTANGWIEKFPAAGVIKTVCGGNDDMKGSYFGIFSVMVENARKDGCDFSGCESDQDYLDAIEAFEDERKKPSTEPTAEERIAAAMEYQNALAE